MLEIIVDNRVIYWVTGGVTVLGVAGKIISNLSLKRMVKAAGNMSKSNHGLMRLVRAKFEHACMVSEKVENVPVFVDKYLYEYKTLGLKLHTWQRIQTICVALCLAFGALGAFLEYSAHGMSDEVIRTGAYGGILGVLLYLFHLTTDENYRLDAVRNYMVDYLENVCLHKYEKIHQRGAEKFVKEDTQKDSQKDTFKDSSNEQIRPNPAKEVPTTRPNPEIQPPAMPEPYEVPDVTPPIRAYVAEEKESRTERNAQSENRLRMEKSSQKEEKKQDKDVLIRQILEEFMA